MAKTFNRYLGGKGGGGAAANIYVTGLSQDDLVTMRTPSRVAQGVWDEVVRYEAYENPVMTSDTAPSGIVSASSSVNNSYLPFKALDGNNTNSFWQPKANTSASDTWWQYEFNNEIVVNKVYIGLQYSASSRSQLGAESRNAIVKFQASSDGVTFLDVSENITLTFRPTNYNPVDYGYVDLNPTQCKYLRMQYVSTDFSNNYVAMSGVGSLCPMELRVYGLVPTTIPCFRLLADEYGMHTITATNGSKTSTEEVLVDALMDFWVEMDYKLWLYKYGDERETVTGGIFLASGSYGNAVWEKRIDELYHSGGTNNNTLCTIRNTIDLTQWSKICARVWFESAVNATYSAMWIHTYTNGFTNGFNSNSDTMTKGLPGEDGVVQKTPADTIIEYVIDPEKVNPATTFSIASWYVAKGHIYEIWLE